MAGRRGNGAARFIMSEDAEVYRHVRRGVIGASDDSSRRVGTIPRQWRSQGDDRVGGVGSRAIRLRIGAKWILSVGLARF